MGPMGKSKNKAKKGVEPSPTRLLFDIEDAEDTVKLKVGERLGCFAVAAGGFAASAYINLAGVNSAWLWLTVPVALLALMAAGGTSTEVNEARANLREARHAHADFYWRAELEEINAQGRFDLGTQIIRQKYTCGRCHTGDYILQRPKQAD